MKLLHDNVVALVIAPADGWKTVCVTEYTADGDWHCGINVLTDIDDVLTTAQANKINIVPETCMHKDA